MNEALPFILLGLVLTVGYLVWRLGPGSKSRKREAQSLEAFLAGAEREAREKKAREQGVLDLDPAVAKKQEKLRKMVEQNPLPEGQTGDGQELSPQSPRVGEEKQD